jgi:hypothetical protein
MQNEFPTRRVTYDRAEAARMVEEARAAGTFVRMNERQVRVRVPVGRPSVAVNRPRVRFEVVTR